MRTLLMLLIVLVCLPMYGQEWINFGKAKECTKDSVYLAVKSPLYKDFKYEGDMVLYKDQSGKFAVTVPVISSSLKQDAMRIPGTVTVVGTGAEQVITYEFLNVEGRYTTNLLELFKGNDTPGEIYTPVEEVDPFSNPEEYGYTHYLSFTSDLQKRISTKSLEGGRENLRIVIKGKPKDAMGLIYYLGAKVAKVGKEANFRREGKYKIPDSGLEIVCKASNSSVLGHSILPGKYGLVGIDPAEEITCLFYTVKGSPEQIKSAANFLLKDMKCNAVFAPKKKEYSGSYGDIKKYEQDIVVDGIVIRIEVTAYSTDMKLQMSVSEKQPEPKRKLKSDYDIGGLEYKEMSAMRLTQILDSLATNTKEIEKKEITKPSENPFKRKPKVIGILEYKYCNYFYEKDWAVIDSIEGTTEVIESEICYRMPTNRREIEPNLYITEDLRVLIKKVGDKTRYYKCLKNPSTYQRIGDGPDGILFKTNQ